MTKNIEAILSEKFFQFRKKTCNIQLVKEVPVYSRSVDMVEYDAETGNLTAVEFKIHDWKRAIQQLISVAACFDYLVLCIPKPKTEQCSKNIENTCISLGIGLFYWDAFDDTFIHVCLEQQTSQIWKVQKEQIIHYVNGMEEQ